MNYYNIEVTEQGFIKIGRDCNGIIECCTISPCFDYQVVQSMHGVAVKFCWNGKSKEIPLSFFNPEQFPDLETLINFLEANQNCGSISGEPESLFGNTPVNLGIYCKEGSESKFSINVIYNESKTPECYWVFEIGSTNLPIKELTLAAYKCCEDSFSNKKYIDYKLYKHPTIAKETIKIFEFQNPDGSPCFTLDVEGTDVVDINDYEMSFQLRNIGALVRQRENSAVPEFPFNINFCPNETAGQDLIALVKGSDEYLAKIAELETKFPLPAGAVYGVSDAVISQYQGEPEKQRVRCHVTDVDLVVSSNQQILSTDNTTVAVPKPQYITVGGRLLVTKPKLKFDVIDGTDCTTCYDDRCEIVDGDFMVDGNADADGNALPQALNVNLCITCFATNPAASNRSEKSESVTA